MKDLLDLYSLQTQQEKFSALVSARVNQILSGTARPLDMKKVGGTFNTEAQETLFFADLIARNVCSNLNKIEGESSE